MQNQDAGDNQITRLQHQLDEVNTSLNTARKALRNIKRKIEEIDSVVDLEDKSRKLRQYVHTPTTSPTRLPGTNSNPTTVRPGAALGYPNRARVGSAERTRQSDGEGSSY